MCMVAVIAPNDARHGDLNSGRRTPSAILRQGPSYFGVMREALQRWMESMEFASVNDIRGRLSFTRSEVPSAFERAQYIRMLSGWSSWLAYGAYVRSHPDDVKVPS